MNRTWNYYKRRGGAMGLGDAPQILPPAKKDYKKTCQRPHKWVTRKWTRTCRVCGLEQSTDGCGEWA